MNNTTTAAPPAPSTPETRQEAEIRTIQSIVADYHGYNIAGLLSESRAEPLVTIRQVAMYLCRKLTRATLHDVAAAFAKRDHCTVMHAVRAIDDKIAVDRDLRIRVAQLKKQCARAIAPTSTPTP